MWLLNLFRSFYHLSVDLMSRLHAYETRMTMYLLLFKPYVEEASIVADIGCGAGVFSMALAREGRLTIALDIQGEVLRRIEGSKVERVQADAHYLPFREETIDCVLSLTNGTSSEARGAR